MHLLIKLIHLFRSFHEYIHFYTFWFKTDSQLLNGNSDENTPLSAQSNQQTRRKSPWVSPGKAGFKSGFAEVRRETWILCKRTKPHLQRMSKFLSLFQKYLTPDSFEIQKKIDSLKYLLNACKSNTWNLQNSENQKLLCFWLDMLKLIDK